MGVIYLTAYDGYAGGESGLRTHGTFLYTRLATKHDKPSSVTSPFVKEAFPAL